MNRDICDIHNIHTLFIFNPFIFPPSFSLPLSIYTMYFTEAASPSPQTPR